MFNINLKYYFLRLFIINFFGFFYLIDTISFYNGFFSVQSIFYSLNIYLVYLFIFFEAFSSFFSNYGLNFNFFYLILVNLKNLNFGYVGFIFYQNLNLIYFFSLTFFTLFFLEKSNYSFKLKLKFFNKKRNIFPILLFVFIVTNINPALTHLEILQRFKHIFNIGAEEDRLNKNSIHQNLLYKTFYKNNFFRNDNWFHVAKISFLNLKLFSAKLPQSQNIYNEFSKVIKNEIIEKDYNNIYIIINESYPNFRNIELQKKLFDAIVKGNEDFFIKVHKKKWNKDYSTLGVEMNFFCNNEADFHQFTKLDLKDFVEENNCWINKFRHKNMIYIHSYESSFFGRNKYRSFFNESFFKEDLKKKNLKECYQRFSGICDTEILDNLENIIKTKNNNFLIFLTLNNHAPTKNVTDIKYIDCEKHYPLNQNDQNCILYNNQIHFNKSLSKLISKMSVNDILVFFADHPPHYKHRNLIYFEDTLPMFFFKKK